MPIFDRQPPELAVISAIRVKGEWSEIKLARESWKPKVSRQWCEIHKSKKKWKGNPQIDAFGEKTKSIYGGM